MQVVRDWLVESGIAKSRIAHSDTKGWFAFEATTAEVEKLFNAEFYGYEHATKNKVAAACDS